MPACAWLQNQSLTGKPTQPLSSVCVSRADARACVYRLSCTGLLLQAFLQMPRRLLIVTVSGILLNAGIACRGEMNKNGSLRASLICKLHLPRAVHSVPPPRQGPASLPHPCQEQWEAPAQLQTSLVRQTSAVSSEGFNDTIRGPDRQRARGRASKCANKAELAS